MLSWEKGLQAGRKGGRKVFHEALLSTGTSYATFRGYIYTTLKLEKLQENCCGSGAASDETARLLRESRAWLCNFKNQKLSFCRNNSSRPPLGPRLRTKSS